VKYGYARIPTIDRNADMKLAPSIVFVRQQGGQYHARIQDVEVNVWSVGYEINTWDEVVIDDPCDSQGRCCEGRDMTACDCPHIVRACDQSGSDYHSAVSDPLPSWEDIISTVRNKLAKYYKNHNPAAQRFATERWEFRD
jgi:hypothetical protein